MTTKTYLARASLPAAVGGIVSLLLFAPATARAHFELQQPADALVTNEVGDPDGGTQKMNPCGAGQASGIVTHVRAGSMLHVKLTEAVPHGGHYRIAFVPKYDPVSSDLPEPKVTPDAGACDSAEIEATPALPVLSDGLFVHTQAQAAAGTVYETDVKLPDQIGPGTLQVIEFMTPHTPSCFYHHCARLDLVGPDAGVDDGGVVVTGPDSGAGGDSGTSGTGGDADGGGLAGDGGDVISRGGSSDSGGCSVAGDATPSLLAMMIGVVTTGSMLRRRRRR